MAWPAPTPSSSTPYTFTGLTIDCLVAPDNLVVREHFDDFAAGTIRDSHQSTINKRNTTRAFHWLLNANGPRNLFRWGLNRDVHNKTWTQYLEPIPPVGVQVRRREDAGIPEYAEEPTVLTSATSIIYTRYAVTAGSLVETVLKTMPPEYSPESKTGEALVAIAREIRERIY